MTASVPPSFAQKVGITGMGAYKKTGQFPERVFSSTVNPNPSVNEEACFPWLLPEVRAKTVSVARLKVPSKAREEYQKACDASNENRFAEAEQHARGAIAKFQNYPAAWVLLGVILEEQERAEEARDACSHAFAIDAKYMPAYLCSAEVSVRSRKWEEVLRVADQAVALESNGNLYGYYYRATAYFHMNKLAEAKQSAVQAVELDVNHGEPSLYLLLAKIYERQGDVANAIEQLHQLLKRPADRQREDAAKQLLAELESQPATK